MKKNVLIFPCGSEIGLEVNRALTNSAYFEMFGASSILDHGRFVYKNYIGNVPFVHDKDFIDKIDKICKKYKIDFIVPTHDDVVLKLAQNVDKLSAIVITSSKETCEIARYKSKTYQVLQGMVSVPKTYDITDKNITFPVFIKPDIGQGSQGAKKIKNRTELEIAYTKNSDIVISEFLPGQEYTVDCFTDKTGKLIYSRGRSRGRINNGISLNSKPVYNDMFNVIAEKINSVISFNGVWFFQLKENERKELILLEIAPRIAGTMGLFRGIGVNFIQLALFNAMGFDIEIIRNNFDIEIDKALFVRYNLNINYDYVYIDFDDTIIIDNAVNSEVMRFLYQAKNQRKHIVLITKHKNDIYESLKSYYINQDLFDEIILLSEHERKSDYIKYIKSIFIDDSYSERKDVSDRKRIPVFNTDAIEALIEYRH